MYGIVLHVENMCV